MLKIYFLLSISPTTLILDYNNYVMKSFLDFKSLPVHMITSFIVLVLLTAITVGIPAIWLLQNQLEQQAWSQVEQGQRAVISLYAAKYLEVQNLAILTAQRPTLQALLEQRDDAALNEYLDTLQSGANVDLIDVCTSHQIVAETETHLPICVDKSIDEYYVYTKTPPAETWMIARTPIENSTVAGEVIIGVRLSDDFALDMRDQTGLEHTLCTQKQPIATSFKPSTDALSNLKFCIIDNEDQSLRFTFDLNDIPYYAAYIPLNASGLNAAVALDISEISSAQKRLVLWMTAAMLGIATAGSGLGVLLARRISQPLVRLSESAASFSLGDLESPVKTETRLREITQVAKALDSSRIDLLATLTSLERERDWSKNLLASIVEGIFTLDSENRITFFSHGAELVTGWSETEVIGHLVDDVFRLGVSEKPFSSILPSLPRGRQKADVVLSDNRVASLAITFAQLTRSGEKDPEVALVFRDISEEEAMHRLLGHFIANIAHEFLTPLSALEASIELLLDQAPELSLDELRELYNSLHLGILGLHTLVDNLLESANIEARRFQISPRTSDLGVIIAEAVQTMQPLLSKYEQFLTVELPVEIPVVQADPRRTVQVLINLLSNASRYGPPGEEIMLQVKTNPPYVRLEVIDQGPGIPLEQRESIFRRFVFPHDEDAISKAGAGLGLSVVKAIVLAHGGQVGVDDQTDGGSIFWFTLPIDSEAA